MSSTFYLVRRLVRGLVRPLSSALRAAISSALCALLCAMLASLPCAPALLRLVRRRLLRLVRPLVRHAGFTSLCVQHGYAGFYARYAAYEPCKVPEL